MKDLYFIWKQWFEVMANMQLFTSQDSIQWTGVVWIKRKLIQNEIVCSNFDLNFECNSKLCKKKKVCILTLIGSVCPLYYIYFYIYYNILGYLKHYTK